MTLALTLIGYGEAGRTFSRAAGWETSARVFDILQLTDSYAEDGVEGCNRMSAAVADASLVISVVTADQALAAARDAALAIGDGALYLDMNSVAPATKRTAATLIEAAGAHYVDVAIMSPVNPKRLAVPLYVSGPHAPNACERLAALGFTDCRIVGDDIGRASTIKMLRSVMYKGVEALTAECLIACEVAGVTEEVMGSFGNDWATGADYRLDRMMVHGTRRAAEMAEVVKTLDGLGCDALMTRGTVARQALIGGLDIKVPPHTLAEKLAILRQHQGEGDKHDH